MSALTFKVSGDSSGLMRSLDGAKGALSGLANMGRRLAIGGALAGAAAGVAGLALSYRGLKDALDLGGRLSDVAANTGLTAGQAMVMERAFSDAGLSGEKLQGTITKMQKSIVEGRDGLMTYRRAFEGIGLSVDDLAGMAPAEQFKAIQAALSGMSDPAERSARAMQIFGRSGAELGALFSDSGAMSKAAESVGDQAAIMDKSAAAFDRSSDLLGGMGIKIQGFFVGMASSVNSVLLPVLEEMNKFDFAKIGEQVGTAVAMIVEAFGQNKIGEILSTSLMIAGKGFVNFMVNGVRAVVIGLIEGIKNIPKIILEGFRMLLEPGFWKGLLYIMRGLGSAIAYAFMELLPTSIASFFGVTPEFKKELQGAVADEFKVGTQLISRAGQGFGDSIVSAGGDVMAAMLKEMNSSGPLDTKEETERLAKVMEGLRKAVEERKNQQEEEFKTKENPVVPEIEAGGALGRVMAPVISSLGRVGGAGSGSLIPQSLDMKRNEYLRDIARNTGAMRSGSVAVYG